MRAIVPTAFYEESGLLEGILRGMYIDVVGKVTAGLGNLMDYGTPPWALATMWKWRHKTTQTAATEAEVIAEWHRVKHSGGENWGNEHKTKFAELELADGEMERLFAWRLAEDEKIYRHRFPEWDRLPADAQFAIALYGWGRGASFSKPPELVTAIAAGDWVEAAQHGQWTGFNLNRRAAIAGHFMAAASVVDENLDPEQLHYRFVA